MKARSVRIGLAVFVWLLGAPCGSQAARPTLPTEQAILTDAPLVPPPIRRKHEARVEVHLEVREVVQRLADGVDYTFWTFGGKVPGKFIRVREGDLVEFHLENHPSNKMPHNIDLHAVNGPGGGAAASLTAPGHSSVFTFRVLNPGLFVYHCAAAPVPMHIGNGMYGMILVEPKQGLPRVDHEYYVMQSEFYLKKATEGENSQLFSFNMPQAIEEKPQYVVFNGSVGALTEAGALTANAGETLRLFVGNGGPNLTSSFHVIGEIFDKLYPEGGTSFSKNVQTTMIPAGGAATMELKVNVPGTYVLVDHSITRAFYKGALGQLKVNGSQGASEKLVYSGKIRDEDYPPAAAVKAAPASDLSTRSTTAAAPSQPGKIHTKEDRIQAGKLVFGHTCAACHQSDGNGIPNIFPPLAGSDFLNHDPKRAIRVVTGGLTGQLTVNGKSYNGVMPAWHLSDEDIANVLTFIYNSWDNSGVEVLPSEVKANRVKVEETDAETPAT